MNPEFLEAMRDVPWQTGWLVYDAGLYVNRSAEDHKLSDFNYTTLAMFRYQDNKFRRSAQIEV